MKKKKEPRPEVRRLHQEGRYKATCQRKFQLPWREASPPKKMTIKWIRTRRLSIKKSLYTPPACDQRGQTCQTFVGCPLDRCRANITHIRQSRPWLSGARPQNLSRCSLFARKWHGLMQGPRFDQRQPRAEVPRLREASAVGITGVPRPEETPHPGTLQ